MNDHRNKGCPNEGCIMRQEKVKQKVDNDYCPKCGYRLILVCSKCFKEIQNLDRKHKICDLCEAKARVKSQERVETIKKGAGKAAKVAAAFAAPVVAGVVGKVVKDGQKGAIDVGVNLVKGMAKVILKK